MGQSYMLFLGGLAGGYLVLPLATGVGYDLVRLEGTFIGRLSPSLNTIGKAVRAKNKARPGRKERAKKAVGPAVRRNTLIVFTDLATGRRNASLSTLLEEVSRAGGKNITLTSSGGQVWGEKWSIVKRLYGTSIVRTDEGKVPLARAKCMMEAGGQFRIAPVEKAENARLRGKGYLRQLLEMPRKKGELKNFDIPKLIFLYRSAREFKTKTTRRVLKEMIADVVRKKTGVEVKKKVNVKATYNHRLRKRRIRETIAAAVGSSRIHPVLKSVLKQRIRVVWGRNKNVQELLTNHRMSAREPVVECTCKDEDLPREGGHVLLRIAHYPAIPSFLCNGKNILQNTTWSSRGHCREKSSGH
ncbi:hypothetical protein CBR_g691 [Chara braunii]|uniref:Uncharacterized protein n=1 Tax=Chara braunii TaxID=69332 RepID=A0A388KBX2_CHABU|nr:hypothetical protein CBR_g691 [Chara braunii]|eukprot:GBG67562.1 hypothetical protein CBR_g691 [Chara braunii]